jgi:ribosomal protein S12 methylthiotransferase
MSKIFVISLGCPKNQTDTEEILGGMLDDGNEVVFEEEQADEALLNTCAFIKPAIEETESEIEYLLDLKRKGIIKKVTVAGCYVERFKNEIMAKYPEIDELIGVKKAISLPKSKFLTTMPHSAYLKIADGCDNKCTYCTIPSIRGGYRSKPIDDIIIEAESLAAQGVKELSLVAQDTTSYGKDLYKKTCFNQLLKRLTKIKGIEWIRIMYAYPELVTDELIRLIAEEDKICNYLDMPLQHISDGILKSMSRRVSGQEIREKIEMIRSIVPDMAIRTNFIVGFPGETADDFAELKSFIKEAGFSKVGVFKYWQEKGTPAARMANQIDEKTKTERYDQLIMTQSRVIDKLNKQIIGKTMKVLIDLPFIGRSQYLAPEIDGGIAIDSDKAYNSGDFLDLKITAAEGYSLRGVPLTT